MPGSTRTRWLVGLGLVLLIAAGATAVILLTGGDDAEAQTIRFQKPTESGPDPFVKPADVAGKKTVKLEVGQGPFGGTGSDRVCDRELLIRSLRARPDRMAEWARVLGVEPEIGAVARYIRTLRPVTLTRDTRVTNHSFVDGRAVGYQAILQAGTAVLVDKDGLPVARCRCGNPLLRPIDIPEATCYGCPADYHPPPPCKYYDYDDADFRRYGDDYFLRVYRRSDYRNVCYLPYPSPPRVRRRTTPSPDTATPKTPPTTQARSPAASFSPSSGTVDDTYTLSVSGFRPNVSLSATLTRPNGVPETFTIQTNSAGSGSKSFPPVDRLTGTYVVTVRDPGSGDSASASTSVRENAPQQQPAPQPEPQLDQQAPSDDLQCDPPRSQLEAEQCAGVD